MDFCRRQNKSGPAVRRRELEDGLSAIKQSRWPARDHDTARIDAHPVALFGQAPIKNKAEGFPAWRLRSELRGNSEFGLDLLREPSGNRLGFRVGINHRRPAQEKRPVQMPHHGGAGDNRQRLQGGCLDGCDYKKSRQNSARHLRQSSRRSQ